MFRTGQIINATQLLKQFRKVANHLKDYPEPILVTQKNKASLVLVPAEMFEDLMDRNFGRLGEQAPPPTLQESLSLKF